MSSVASVSSNDLQKKLETILAYPHSSIFYSTFRDFDRDIKHDLSSVSRMIFPPIRFPNIATRKATSFTYGRHLTFSNLYECHPNKQRMLFGLKVYKKSKSRKFLKFPSFYSNAYHMEYGKKSSFWSVAHIKDFESDKAYFDAISMHVMMDVIKRKKIEVTPQIKSLCDDNYNNVYPQELKPKYNELKNNFIDDLKILNQLRNNKNKSLIYSYGIQLRFGDEDINHHLNVATYMKYAYEGLLNYDQELKNNKKVIYCMSNVYWNEIRMKYWNHCYINIWDIIKTKTKNAIDVELYIGTIDIDKSKKYIQYVNDEQHTYEWTHYHGFVAGVVDIKKLKRNRSKL